MTPEERQAAIDRRKEKEKKQLEKKREYNRKFMKDVRGHKAWREQNKHRIVAWRYGISKEDAKLLLEVKNCEVCGESVEAGSRYRNIDHCHKTKKIRGVLCKNCNMALGMVRESETILLALLEYVRKHGNAGGPNQTQSESPPQKI